jgi:hypothetical protein
MSILKNFAEDVEMMSLQVAPVGFVGVMHMIPMLQLYVQNNFDSSACSRPQLF